MLRLIFFENIFLLGIGREAMPLLCAQALREIV